MFTIETSIENQHLFDSFLSQHPKDVGLVKKKMLIGDSEIIQIVLALSPVMITAISAIIVEMIKSKKEFSLKNGKKEISLKGYTDKTLNSKGIQNLLTEVMNDADDGQE